MTCAVDICDVVRTPGVSASLANGTVTVKIGDHYAPVRVRRVKTPMPCSMWLLLCPVCRRQCRELHTMGDGGLACRVCAKVRHPDQRTSGSELGRIQRCAQQIRQARSTAGTARGLTESPGDGCGVGGSGSFFTWRACWRAVEFGWGPDLDRAILMTKCGSQ